MALTFEWDPKKAATNQPNTREKKTYAAAS
jgi:hypothetical protein